MSLFTPAVFGDLHIRNRVVMAPLTRCRAPGHMPNQLMAKYYRQRANAGLIMTEATAVSEQGIGYPDTPGIWSKEQAAEWKKITDGVHAEEEGALILCQLWHVGAVSHPIYHEGRLPVSASTTFKPPGHVSLVRPEREYVEPRVLETAEIAGIVADFANGARMAQLAGFDGVLLHGANGYLLEQFLRARDRPIKDQYGGPVENRARLMLEVVDELIDVWGAGRVGVHLRPGPGGDPRGEENYVYVSKELGARGIAFISIHEAISAASLRPKMKAAFGGPVIANKGLTKQSATQLLAEGGADAAMFGTLYISNPNLVEKLRSGAELRAGDPHTFMRYYFPEETPDKQMQGGVEEGYIDYAIS